jgi:hypothetical protein
MIFNLDAEICRVAFSLVDKFYFFKFSEVKYIMLYRKRKG